MARLDEIPEPLHHHIAGLTCPTFTETPWVDVPTLSDRRVAILSTAGLQRRGDTPFAMGSFDFRVIPGDTPARDLVMSHVSTNFDRTGFQQDINVVFPIDRLRELANEGMIAAPADYHYAFMGATDPMLMEPHVQRLAELLKGDGVDTVLLIPI